jgi:hypothetical protein
LALRVAGLLAEGHEPSEIMDALGDERSLGKSLRTQRLRGKSLFWKARRLSRRAWWVSLGLLIPLYIYFAIQFHTARPNVRRNMAREISERAMAVPEADRALPFYLHATEMLPDVPEALVKTWPHVWPGDPQWAEASDYIKTCEPGLEVLRRAAAMPGVGMVLTDAEDPRWSHNPEVRARPRGTESENPPQLNLMLPQLGNFRWSARLLAADAHKSASEHDSARVLADVQAMLGIARHSTEARALIAELVGLSIASMDCQLVGEVIERYPGLLSDAQLSTISQQLATYAGGGRLVVHPDDDLSSTIEDFLQRAYTDDGHGDGRMCAEGLRYLDSMKDGKPGHLSIAGAVFGPINVQFMASRRELHDKCQELLRLIQRDIETPAWQRNEFLSRREIDRIEANPDLNKRYMTLCILVPAVAKAIEAAEQLTQERDATLVVIALERYRMKTGAYPPALTSLVPDLLPEVPIDHFDGKPIKCRFSDGKPLVYCCGSDGDDDGGRTPAGWRGNDKARRWFPPSKRGDAADGDLILWPLPPEPSREE